MSPLGWVVAIIVAGIFVVLGGIVLAFARGWADDWDNWADRKRGLR